MGYNPLDLGPLVSLSPILLLCLCVATDHMTLRSRAGGPGTSKDDLEWLDRRLKLFLVDGNFGKYPGSITA